MENLLTQYAIFEAEMNAAKSEYDSAKSKMDAAKFQMERIKAELNEQMAEQGIDKFECSFGRITYRKSVETIVQDVELLPYGFYKITKSADKTAIKAAIKSGQTVTGATLAEWQNIQIKTF